MSSPLTSLQQELAGRVKQARGSANLTQAELAAQLGVSIRTLQNWEAGTSFPRARHRRAIDALLDGQAA